MAKSAGEDQPRPVRRVGSSQEDLSDCPEELRRRVGGALWEAQIGRKAPYAKPLKGFGDAGVLEIVDDFDGNTFRAVYRGATYPRCVRAARLPEEIQARRRNAQGPARRDRPTAEASERG